jgi:hypothetical protein
VKWADCLPGTAGYENGGGQQTRAAQAAQEGDAFASTPKAVDAQCKANLANPELDPIRHKVELYRDTPDSPPPIEVASNDSYPTDSDRDVIAKWA